MQPMGHVQLLRGLLDFHLDPQHAVDAPRWSLHGAGRAHTAADMLASEIHLEDGYTVTNEHGEGKQRRAHPPSRLPDLPDLRDLPAVDIRDALRARGHKIIGDYVRGNARSMFGKAQVIIQDHSNQVFIAGSDPRADGCAMPVV
jgi:gamma-glutamyltranspeptidase/glutathione hydrolase